MRSWHAMHRAVQQQSSLRGWRLHGALPTVPGSCVRPAALASRRHVSTSATGDRLYILDMLPVAYRCVASAEKQPSALALQQPSPPQSNMDQSHLPVHKFMVMLLELMRRKLDPPSHMAVVVDVPGTSFRQQKWEQYKAQRPEPPANLHQELSRMLSLVEAMGIPILTVPGVEADDVCGSLAMRAVREGMSVVLVSPDKDFNQLLQPGFSILRYGGSRATPYTHTDFAEEYGIPADQTKLWIDVKALAGDPADNIPGVKNIGPKTALQLVKELGTIEQILEKLQQPEQVQSKVSKARLEMLRCAEGAAAAKFAKSLVTIETNLKAPAVRQPWETFRLKLPEYDGALAVHRAQSMQLLWTSMRLRELFNEWKQSQQYQPAPNVARS